MLKVGRQGLQAGIVIGCTLSGPCLLPMAALAQAAAPSQQSSQPPAADAEPPPPPPDAALPQVEPIITDEQFKQAVPALDKGQDAELNKPLESIEEFERRVTAEAAPTAPESQQPGAQGTAAAGAETYKDEELNKPLVPIQQFDTTPNDFAAAPKSGNVEIPYKTEITGLKEADRQSDADLDSMFHSLSALHKGKGKAANVAMITARLDEDVSLLGTILSSEGWYSANITTQIDRSGQENDKAILVKLAVEPGKRYDFAKITVDAQPTDPPGLIRDNLPLKVGQPVIADRVLGAEANVALVLPENGYPFASLGQRDIALDRDTAEAFYTLPVDTGPRSRFGDFSTKGDLAFDAQHVKVLARFKKGDLYDSRKVDDLRKALLATGLFSTVAAEPKKTGEPAGDGTQYADILVTQDAGPPRTIAGTAGYSSGEGITVEASWTHRNMFPPEGALIVHGIAGTKQQGAGVTFRRSNAGKRDRTVEVVAEALHSAYSAYSAYTGRLAAHISRDSTPIWQKRFTYSLGVELLGTSEKDYDFALGERTRRTYYIAGVSGEAGFDTTDDLLNPTKGYRLTALIQPEGSLNQGFHPYVRARIDASAYASVGDGFVLAGRVRLGSIRGASREEIPPSRRFYAGGGGSVRGFGYQKLGPQDPNGDPLGGRSLNEASAEVRYRFGTYGIVAFVDTGQSYASTTPRFSDLRFGAGLGVRYYTNFGPIRLDVATPIDRRPGENRINIYVSIGQAF